MKQTIAAIALFFLSICTVLADDFVFSPINVLHGLSDNQIRYIVQLPDGRMVFKTSGNINIYDGGRFKYIHQTAAHVYPLKGYDGFYRIYTSGDSLLWIKDNQKLMCVDLRTEKYQATLGSYFTQLGFKSAVDDLFLDSKQRLWLRSKGKLWRSDRSQSLDISANEGTLQDVTSAKNNLYLFYNNGAVVAYDLKTKRKLYSKIAYPTVQQPLFRHTSLVVQAGNGYYQLRNGTKGGFFFFDLQNQVWTKILETNYALNTLVVSPHGVAYISCANGIWVIDCKTGTQQYLPTLKKIDGSVLDTEISTLFYDKQGGLWLGTINQGLLYYHPSKYSFTNVGRSKFNVVGTNDVIVQRFAEDQNGRIYVKCNVGTFSYMPTGADQKLVAVALSSIPGTAQEKLQQNADRSVLTDSRGWQWTATPDGLKLCEPEKKRQRIFYTEDGLSNNFIHALLEDRQHNIWATTSSGITKLQIDEKSRKIHFSAFRADVGTLAGEYNDSAVLEAMDGTLYFGGINGFSRFNPKRLEAKKLPFRPVFTNLFLRGEQVEVGKSYDGRLIFSASAPYTKSVDLAYDQNFLTFEFSALNYQNPSQTYYRYQLQGVDKNWRETSSGRENENIAGDGLLRASYTNLTPGKYKLLVMAASSNQDWQVPVAELNLTIHAPWWKTTLAYALFFTFGILLVFVLVYGYFYYHRKQLERNHREEILLLRIRNLIEQQHYLEAKKENSAAQIILTESTAEESNLPNQADAAFLARALEQVEKNIDVPDYSVEQLSSDLYMDRTGLYRKLIGLLDKSPSLFIRNVRLKKAAALLLEGELSIAEITEKVGFSSSSYLSKCFQEMYGCKPSAYAQKVKNST